MAGRFVIFCTIATIFIIVSSVKAFVIPPVFAPVVHPGLLGMPFRMFPKNVEPPKTKPLSRPFTLNDLPVGPGQFQGQSLQNGGVLFANDGFDTNIIGGVGNGGFIGGDFNGLTLASTNDLNTVQLGGGVVSPMDVRTGLEVSDSNLMLSNAGVNGLVGVNGEISDSAVYANGLQGGVVGFDSGLNGEISDSRVYLNGGSGLQGGVVGFDTGLNGEISDSRVYVNSGSGLQGGVVGFDTGLNGEISDSRVYVNSGSGVSGLTSGLPAEISDSKVLVNGGGSVMGGVPAGSVVTTF